MIALPRWAWALFAALLVGVFAHAYTFTLRCNERGGRVMQTMWTRSLSCVRPVP
jgi:hypothetical protein